MLLPVEKSCRPIVWTIAGSDCSSGAGIQADIKSFEDFSVHGCTALTAITVQNNHSLLAVNIVPVDLLEQQLLALQQDLPPVVIKLGMLANEKILNCVGDFLQKLDSKKTRIVCDPVLNASSGGTLLTEHAITQLLKCLLPKIDLLTPNIPELEVLTQCSIQSYADVAAAAQKLLALGAKAVLVKGGHTENFLHVDEHLVWDFFSTTQSELLVTAPQQFWLGSSRQAHAARGTGCRLSSAIAALLAHGYLLEDALSIAKTYMSGALAAAYRVGDNSFALPAVKQLALEHVPYIAFSCPLPAIHGRTADKNIEQMAFQDCGLLGLYPVVDDISWLEKLLPLGIDAIQLRLKNKTLVEVEQQIISAVALQKKFSTKLFINDYWQLAIKHGAYGVHLGQTDLITADLQAIHRAGLHLGISTHSWWEIARAHSIRPSYIALGPIYATQTKDMPFAAQGLEKLQMWQQLLQAHYQLVAIGGIDLARAQAVLATGIKNIALVSAISQAVDYRQAVHDLRSLFE